MDKHKPAKGIDHSMDSLTPAQHQKLLVLWLLLSANPGTGQYQIDPMYVLDRWSQDIGPHVDQDLPNARRHSRNGQVPVTRAHSAKYRQPFTALFLRNRRSGVGGAFV